MSEGYLPLVPTGPGVYLGKSLVAVKDGSVNVYCINTSTKDVELLTPPVTLEKFETINFTSRSDRYVNADETKKTKKSDRFKELVNELHLENSNNEEKELLLKRIAKFPHQFLLKRDKSGCTNVIKHKINTVGDVSLNKSNYRHQTVHKEVIEKETNKLKSYYAISPSNSPYNSPVWVVDKKADSQANNRYRMIIGYRALNEKTVGNAYPLPDITDILDQLGGIRYFTVLDLASGFHQIEVDPAGRPKTAFSTEFGYFEFNRMTFGLKFASATFQRMMDLVLSGLPGVEMFVYMV